MEELENGIGFVIFHFADCSQQTIHTTLNQKILSDYGVTLPPDTLYDLDHAEFVKIRMDASSIEVSSIQPEAKEGIFKYASRFI